VNPPPTPRTSINIALGGTLLIITLALAGCGGGDPTPDPPPTRAPSPTVTASGKIAPPLPPAATAHTKAGAIAFVRHYIDLINYTQATGDTAPINQVSERKCSSCNATSTYVRNVYRAGGRIAGGMTQIRQIIAVPSKGQDGEFEVDVAIRVTSSRIGHRDGTTTTVRGGANALSVFTKWFETGWRVTQWTRAK